MKKFYTTFIIAIFTIRLFASINVYAPTLVAPVNNAIDQMPNALLNWSPVAGSFGLHYKVQIDFDSLFNNPQTLTSTVTAINAVELNFGKQYFWRVKAIDNLDSSDWSAIRAFTVISKVVLKPMSTNSIWSCHLITDSLMWLQITGITYYDYQIDTIASFNSSVFVTGSVSGGVQRLLISYLDSIKPMYNNTTYYWRIRARHSQDVSAWSQLGVLNICNEMPNAPALNTPLNLSVNQLDTLWLGWVPLHNAQRYKIEYDITSSFTNPTILNFTPSTSNINDPLNSKIFISGLAHNQTYYWRVQAINVLQSTLWSDAWSFTTLSSTVPNLIEPANFAVDIQPRVIFKWTAIPAAVSYWIEYSTNNLFTNSDTLHAVANSDTLTSLLFSDTYYWRVKTLNTNDTSAWSSTNHFTIIDHPVLLSPADASIYQNLNVPLKWAAIQGVTKFKLQVDTTTSFNSALLIDSLVLDTILNINFGTLLDNNTTYYWRLKTLHALDTSSWSAVWSFTTIDSMPTAPVLLSPIDSAVNQMPKVLLKWTPVSGAATYLLEYTENNLFPNNVKKVYINTNSYNVDSLLFSTKYYWRVQAIGGNTPSPDSSNWSNVFIFTVLDSVSLSTPADSSVNQMPDAVLGWTPITGANSYVVEYANNILFTTPTSVATVNSSVHAQNLKFGESYFWRVKAISSVDTSNWSLAYMFSVIDTLTQLSPIDASTQLLAVIMTWETISGVTLYECQVDTTTAFNSTLLNKILVNSNLPLVQAFSEQTLFGTSYYWRVRAINTVDTTVWSSVWSFTTENNFALAMPLNGALDIMPNTSLRCYNLAGATNYQFELDTTPLFNSFAYQLLFTVNDLPFVEIQSSELYFGTKYYWRSKARVGANFSAWTPTWNFTTVDTVNLTAPLNNSNVTIKNPLLKWKAFEGITNYVLWLDTSATFSNPTVYNVTTTSTDTMQYSVLGGTLIYSEKYYWKVKAVHGQDSSTWSNVWNFNYDYNVGIEDNSSITSAKIYPNPTNGNFAIEINMNNSTDAKLLILDITGRVVYDEMLNLKSGNNYKSMNLSFLKQGIYIVNIKNDKINLNKKLILNN